MVVNEKAKTETSQDILLIVLWISSKNEDNQKKKIVNSKSEIYMFFLHEEIK